MTCGPSNRIWPSSSRSVNCSRPRCSTRCRTASSTSTSRCCRVGGGAAPVERAILAGDTETGVCLMRIDEGLDTGPVYACTRVEHRCRRDGGGVARTTGGRGTALLVDRLDDDPRSTPEPQQGETTYATKLDNEEFHLDPSTRGAAELARVVRAGNPRPGAWLTIGDDRLKVLRRTWSPSMKRIDDRGVGTIDTDARLGTVTASSYSTRYNRRQTPDAGGCVAPGRTPDVAVANRDSRPRSIALDALERIDGARSRTSSCRNVLRTAALSPRDRASVTAFVYGALRLQRVLDDAIAPVSNRPLDDLDPRVRAALRFGPRSSCSTASRRTPRWPRRWRPRRRGRGRS